MSRSESDAVTGRLSDSFPMSPSTSPSSVARAADSTRDKPTGVTRPMNAGRKRVRKSTVAGPTSQGGSGEPAAVEEVTLGFESSRPWIETVSEVDMRPKPHGLLTTPHQVETIVAEEEQRLLKKCGIVPTSEARQRMVDSLNLQYYFDGIDIAYRRTPHGVEVLAVGLEEVGAFLRETPPAQREGVVFGQG
jgi:hypothetical protein